MQTPLKDRVNGDWSALEARLFNLVTECGHKEFLFSKRLRITQAMLDAYEAEVAVLRAEREADYKG